MSIPGVPGKRWARVLAVLVLFVFLAFDCGPTDIDTWDTLDASVFKLDDDQRTGDLIEIIDGLAAHDSVNAVDVVDLHLNREGKHLPDATVTEVADVTHYHTGFRWDSGDQGVEYWVPQGITGTAAAQASGETSNGRKLLLVSWYYDMDDSDSNEPKPENCDIPCECTTVSEGYGSDVVRNKGVRVSFVDVTKMSRVNYRHTLLVEPYRRQDGTPDYCPVPIHAGGIAWMHHLLYVADTSYGLRVFDTSRILEVSTDDKSIVGYHGDEYHAFNYRYILPQVKAYKLDDDSEPFRFSFVAVDRSTSPMSLVTGEYCRDSEDDNCDAAHPGRILRWELDDSTYWMQTTDGVATAVEAYASNTEKLQGALAYNRRFWLSQSNGSSSPGKLIWFDDDDHQSADWAVGPEDLHYAPGSHNLWTLTEYDGKRTVFAVKVDDYE